MKNSLLIICFVFMTASSCTQTDSRIGQMQGPLRVSDKNPGYFTDDSGKAVYLTGSHTWNNLVDMGSDSMEDKFDYDFYLNWLKKYNHNFFRLWAWELMNWNTTANRESVSQIVKVSPHPWLRKGPGNALDGQLKFDLDAFNPDYFNRLKERVKKAGEAGIYVSVMLFEGWGLQFSPDAFANHPFHPENNINGINGDLNDDGSGVEIHALSDKKITDIQEKYVRKVIDTINEFDNVLYEISNENHPPSTEWQYHIIEFIKDYEENLPKQHPVGMTFQYKGGSNQTLFESPADWISPNPEGGYRDNPPAGDGSKVVINDTDHLWGIGGNEAWVWKSFLRGLNPIFMDPYDCKVLTGTFDSTWVEPIRISMGYSRTLAERMDLISMIPEPELASSSYCLANRGKEYLVYLPESQEVSVDLSDITGTFNIEWFDSSDGSIVKGTSVKGGSEVSFISPFEKTGAVLYLKNRN